MTRRFFSGNSLEQAVLMAARHYELEPDELAYRQIEKKHGFLRTRKAVMIAVDPDNPRSEPEVAADTAPATVEAPAPEAAVAEPLAPEPIVAEPPAPEPIVAEAPDPHAPGPEPEYGSASEAPSEAPDEPPAEVPDEVAAEPPQPEAAPVVAEPRPAATQMVEPDEELLTAAEDATRTLLRFAGIDADAEAGSGGERVEVEIEGPDASLLVVEGGKGLLSIQHLLPRMLRGLTGRSSFVRVDSQEFHRMRRERLEALAAKEAEAASRSGRPRTLPPMAPDERRIVHLALKEAPGVVTESRGRGLHKQVVVRPVAGDGGSDDIEARHGF